MKNASISKNLKLQKQEFQFDENKAKTNQDSNQENNKASNSVISYILSYIDFLKNTSPHEESEIGAQKKEEVSETLIPYKRKFNGISTSKYF